MADLIHWWQGLLLGLIQGFTEYLPVSSSGHLAILQLIFGLRLPLSFDILLHLATLIPTIWIFRRRIISLLFSFCQIAQIAVGWRKNRDTESQIGLKNDARYILLILIATAFTFIVAFPQKDLNLKFQPLVIGLAFLATGLLLGMQQFLRGKKKTASLGEFPWSKAILFAICIGIVQGIAALPGVSRSGITISVALLFGLKHREAGEFSFIISIPVIIGALILDSHEFLGLMAIVEKSGLFAVILGFATACISGFLALNLLLRLLNRGKLHLFSVYLFILAIFTLCYPF